jgi:hypothetical protein
MARSDPTMWLCATVRTLQRRVLDLELQLRESKNGFSKPQPSCEASASHSTSVEKDEASASLIASVRCAPPAETEEVDYDDLADYHGFAEFGNQWDSYLNGDVSKLEACNDGRDNVLNVHFEAQLPVPVSTPLCHAPFSTASSPTTATLSSQSACKQVRFSTPPSLNCQPHDMEFEAMPHDGVFDDANVSSSNDVLHVTSSSAASVLPVVNEDDDEFDKWSAKFSANVRRYGRTSNAQRFSAVSQQLINDGEKREKKEKKVKKDKKENTWEKNRDDFLIKLRTFSWKRYCFKA